MSMMSSFFLLKIYKTESEKVWNLGMEISHKPWSVYFNQYYSKTVKLKIFHIHQSKHLFNVKKFESLSAVYISSSPPNKTRNKSSHWPPLGLDVLLFIAMCKLGHGQIGMQPVHLWRLEVFEKKAVTEAVLYVRTHTATGQHRMDDVLEQKELLACNCPLTFS